MSLASLITIIVCVGTILVLACIHFYNRFKQDKEVLKETEEFTKKLSELRAEHDITERFYQMNEWIKTRESNYAKNYIAPAWKQFYQKYMKQGAELKIVPDVYDFFLEEELVNKYGNRRYSELIPGIFLSIGILGTFTSLAFGIADLNLNGGTESMKTGVSALLSGMKSKFISSIAGLIVSISWQFFDKNKFLPNLQKAFLKIRDAFDEAFPTQDQNVFLVQMLENQKKQMNDLQVFMSEQMIPQMISGFNQSLEQSLLPPMAQTQELMNELITSAAANQMDGVKQLTSEVMTSLNEITGEHMKQLGEALKATVEWQKKVHEEMTGLVGSMQEAAQNQSEMVEKTTVLTHEIHKYTDNITNYQQVLEGTVAQLNETTFTNSE